MQSTSFSSFSQIDIFQPCPSLSPTLEWHLGSPRVFRYSSEASKAGLGRKTSSCKNIDIYIIYSYIYIFKELSISTYVYI